MARDPRINEAEKAREAKIGDDDHDAEQQDDRSEVYGSARFFERQDARDDHQTGPDQGDTRAVDPEAWNLADGQR